MKHIIGFLLLLQVIGLSASAQNDPKAFERNLWRTRADILTNNLLKDASNTDALDRALLMAQLSDLWWESERTQANSWIQKSVDAIAFYPVEEAKDQKEKFFRVARQVLALISNHNKKQSSRLLELLSKSEKDTPDKEKKLNAEALIEQALRIVKTDAPQAAKLGLLALALDFPSNAEQLAWNLRRYNSDLANQFFRAALSIVSTAPDREKLSVLCDIAFPENRIPDFPSQLLLPRELKIAFLNFVADHVYRQQLKFSGKAIQNCLGEGVLATTLKNQFTELLPQKLPMVEQAIDICLATIKPQVKQLLNPQNADRNNVEELLKQADELRGDPLVRGRYLLTVAATAIQQKKFATVVEILEKMTDEEKKVDIDFWEDLRLDSGAGLAFAEFKEGDVPRAQKTLKDLPNALRPLAQITFVFQASPEDIACSQVCVNLLNEARRGIVKSDLRFVRKSSYWLLLVKLYSEYKLEAEAAEAFREMITAFNSARTDANTSSNDALSNQIIAEAKRTIPGFSLTLFETKEDSMFESVRLLGDEQARTEISLQFLRMILQKYQSLKVESVKKTAVTN